ncbi:MAG: hypothetical protein GC151_06990 [Betaproteobacteria bacterium]|nr:hypothetical protein [Betaproteobacteria bacterium]
MKETTSIQNAVPLSGVARLGSGRGADVRVTDPKDPTSDQARRDVEARHGESASPGATWRRILLSTPGKHIRAQA